MSHVYCPECGFQNPEAANYCARCGAYLRRDEHGETTVVRRQFRTAEASGRLHVGPHTCARVPMEFGPPLWRPCEGNETVARHTEVGAGLSGMCSDFGELCGVAR